MIDTKHKPEQKCQLHDETSGAQGAVDSPALSEIQIKETWLNTKEAAAYLRISKKHLLNLVSSGKVPYYKFIRGNRYRLDELRQLLLANRRGGL